MGQSGMVVVMILSYVVALGLAICTLVATLRWPLIRGKHLLCAFLALELAGQVSRALLPLIARFVSMPSFIGTLGLLSFVSHTVSSVLLLLFALAMGAELRERLAHESEDDEGRM